MTRQGGPRCAGRRSERLLTVEEVAAYLHLSRTTIYRLTWRKALRTVRVGWRVHIPASALLAYLRGADEG